MRIREMRDMSVEELSRKQAELSAEIFNLRFQLATNQLEKPSRITAARRDLARIKTLLVEKKSGKKDART
jgi:large subunit ribosomal protein L29